MNRRQAMRIVPAAAIVAAVPMLGTKDVQAESGTFFVWTGYHWIEFDPGRRCAIAVHNGDEWFDIESFAVDQEGNRA